MNKMLKRKRFFFNKNTLWGVITNYTQITRVQTRTGDYQYSNDVLCEKGRKGKERGNGVNNVYIYIKNF